MHRENGNRMNDSNGDAQVPAEGRLRYRAHPDCALLCIVGKNSDPQETLMEMHPLRNKDGVFSPTRLRVEEASTLNLRCTLSVSAVSSIVPE